MPIIVKKIYVGEDLKRSQGNGYQLQVKAEAEIVVIPKGSDIEFEFAGVRIVEKKDGSGLTIVPPSSKRLKANGEIEYINLFSIPKQWFNPIKEKVLEKYETFDPGAPLDAVNDEDDDDLKDPFEL